MTSFVALRKSYLLARHLPVQPTEERPLRPPFISRIPPSIMKAASSGRMRLGFFFTRVVLLSRVLKKMARSVPQFSGLGRSSELPMIEGVR